MSLIGNNSVRCVSVITLLAFLNLIVGCTANVDISFDEAEKSLGRSIPGVVLVTEIEGVTLRAGGEVEFNERRGIYDRRADWIGGVTPAGDSVEILLSDIEYVLLREASIDRPKTVMVGARSFKKTQRTRSWKLVNSRSVRPGNVVQFSPAGGRYDSKKRLITGVTEKGKYIEIAVDEVLFVQIKKFSAGKSVGLVGLVLVYLFAATAWAIESGDFYHD